METEYLFDITKIVEGAADGDRDKVFAYVKQLADRLENKGEAEAAKWLRDALQRGKATKFGFAKAIPAPPSASLPRDSESQIPTADAERFVPNSVDLFLSPEVEKVVKQFLAFFRAADRLAANGVGLAPSMLMFGPPGCGKTQLARFIAADLGLPLITARIDGLISSYLGSTAKNLRLLFEHAMSRPCVLFLDEFDALAKMRDDSRELGELKRVVISLLQNIDAMERDHVLLAATNHDHLLDPAIWRRFTYKLKISEPTAEARAKMLCHFFGKFGNADLVQVLTFLTEGLSGAQIRHIAEECIRAAVLADQGEVSVRDAASVVFDANAKLAGATPEERIRMLRNQDPKTFTQARLADLFNISQGHVSRLLKGGA